ncbi:MAG: tail fiber domain-containing protein [Flavobacterium sp.]|nr:tail fiber domain-containing protein [Flavobacterium sp.]
MKTETIMKNFTTILILLISSYGMAQVGVNTTTPNAMMEISSTTNGFLLPRVALAGTNVAAPVVNPQGGAILESTLVYNTATVAGVNGVTPGYYYWNGTRWITFTGNSSRDWSLEGNSGITTPAIPGTYGTSLIGATENFFGTTDANDIVFGTNGIERMRLKQSSGNVGIGTANPSYKLDILAPGNTIGLQILSGNASQLSYLSLGRTYEYAQIGAATTGTFFTDAQNGDMAIKNFNTGKLLLGASYIDTADMSIIPGGNVGINTSSPGTLFDVRGINNWDTNATEGDVRIGDPTYRFKIGVATGGAGAGDIRLSAHGGTNRIFLGNATNTQLLTVDGLNNRVGIKNTILPNSVLDVNGDLALKEGPALALPNSATPAATLTAGAEYSHYRVTGPTVAFSLQTISGGNDGQVLTLINTTGQIMSIANNNVANGILTGTGGNLTGLTAGNSTVTLVYNATLARWIVTSYAGLTNTRDWRLNGNTAITTPATPVTYGTSTIGATENYIGTTDANDIVFGTNTIERMRVKQTTGNIGVGIADPLQPLHVFKNSDTNKNTILGEARQLSTATDYQNVGVMGYGRGGNSTWGYGAGVMGIGDYTNSWHATGVYAGLGTGVATLPLNTDQALYADGNSLGFSGIFMNGNAGFGTAFPTELVELGGTNAKLYMNSLNSNMLNFNSAGVAAPSFTNRSLGTKLVLYPQVSATSTDYAIGITGSTLWSSVPEATLTYSHRWYSGITEGMRFRGDGRLGIGIIAPTATRLQAYDPSIATSRIAIFRNGNVDGTEVQTGSVEYLHDYSSTTDFNDGANTVGLTVNFGATSGYDLQLANNSAAKPGSNAWTIVSDERLKEDIHPFKDGLETLKKINPVYYKYNGKAKTPKDEYHIGIIAQEMQKVAPYTVGKFEYLPNEADKSNIEEYLSYNSHALDYVTINAIKELDQKQTKTQEVFKNISDFGVVTINSNTMFIPFNEEFKTNTNNAIPVVTITGVNSTERITIIDQSHDGFTISVPDYSASFAVNWIAMARIKENTFEINENYTAADRQQMVDKVKLTPTRLKDRVNRESHELEKFKRELLEAQKKEEQEAKSLAEKMNKNPEPKEAFEKR